MPLSKEIAAKYRPRKGLTEKFSHNIFGSVELSKLTISQVERMEKAGLFIKVKQRKKAVK